MTGPLEGFRIVDVCRTVPGQWATGILADYGADVISVVEPGYLEHRAQGRIASTKVIGVNRRNKRSIFLNLRHESAREVILRLAKVSDGFLESNRPGVVKKLHIDYETLHGVNPCLVYCSLSGFGQYGPYSDIATHDLSYQGVAGLLPQDSDRKPYVPAYNQADLNAIWSGAMAMLVGLLERSRSGKGQFIDVSFCDVSVMAPPGPGGIPARARGAYPAYNIYETKDGKYLTLAISEPWFWDRFCNLLGRPEWKPNFRPQGALREEMFAVFRAFFKDKSLAEWMDILHDHDIQFGPVNRTEEELSSDPHLQAREMVLEAINPVSGDRQLEPGFPFKFSRTKAAVRRGPTLIGSDTGAILRELGYSSQEIAAMSESRAI